MSAGTGSPAAAATVGTGGGAHADAEADTQLPNERDQPEAHSRPGSSEAPQDKAPDDNSHITSVKRKATSPAIEDQTTANGGDSLKRVKVDEGGAAGNGDRHAVLGGGVEGGEKEEQNHDADAAEGRKEEERRLVPTEDESPSADRHHVVGQRPEDEGGAGREPARGLAPAPDPAEAEAPAADRRRVFSQEEKKRGKRLFGGLLSTLSQPVANSQHKKRLEIERRQQEKANRQKVEYDKRQAERLAKLERTRKVEQIKFDERVMHKRHSNMRAMARCLSTTSKPKLYYRPWQLNPEQEQIIRDQTEEAERVIETELREFKLQKERKLKELGVSSQPSQHQPSDTTVGESAQREHSNPAQVETLRPSSAASAGAGRPPSRHLHDKDGSNSHEERDIMVETEEDTVIY